MKLRVFVKIIGWLTILVSCAFVLWSFYQVNHFRNWTGPLLVVAMTRGVPGSLLGVAIGCMLLMLASLDRRLELLKKVEP